MHRPLLSAGGGPPRLRRRTAGAACAAALAAAVATAPPASAAASKGTVEYWAEKWRTRDTAWHRPAVHDGLQAFRSRWLDGAACARGAGARVLVPLCGKTLDLSYLATLPEVGTVVGVEAVPEAVAELAAEQPGLALARAPPGPGAAPPGFTEWCGPRCSVLVGDVFGLETAPAGEWDAVWDRGALVALDPTHQRPRYARLLARFLRPGGRLLVCTVERQEGTPEG